MTSSIENNKNLQLTLYVAGDEPNSHMAKQNLREICNGTLKDCCQIEIVDVYKNFERALAERIVVTPTLVVKGERTSKTVFYGCLHDRCAITKSLQERTENG
jgi:hypothetical protein